VFAGDEGKIFAIRCDLPELLFLSAAYYPWPQLGDVNTDTVLGALKKTFTMTEKTKAVKI
jgi:hypothetical protein